MASDGNSRSAGNAGKPKKRKYLPHSKPVRKGAYPLRPGVQGFLITCDGGRERQAANEAIELLETISEELMDGKVAGPKCKTIPKKPLNKITKFEYSDSSGSDEDSSPACEKPSADKQKDENKDLSGKRHRTDADSVDANNNKLEEKNDLPAKRQCSYGNSVEYDCGNKAEYKPVDERIEDELVELRDRNKRHFVSLDSGCNGVIFIQMNKRPGDPGPAAIIEHIMSLAASTRKHMSRFILRILPAEITCYASEEEISRAIKPLILEHFPIEASTSVIPQKFAVLYEARANTGVDRMTIINAVAKSVPKPHKVDLGNPEKTIIVQVAKTICLIGVAKRYKELSKYNLRQLTSPQTAGN